MEHLFSHAAPGVDGYIWLSIWFSLNVGLTLLNKSIFHFLQFSFPVVLSLVHMVVTSLCSTAVAIRSNERKRLLLDGELRMVAFSVLFMANIVVGNLCLRLVTVSLLQVVRSIIPGITMGLSILFLGKGYPIDFVYALIPVIIGVAMASFGEIDFHPVGFMLTLLVCVLSAFKTVISNKFLVGQHRLHPMDLLSRMSTYAAYEMMVLPVVLGERARLELWPFRPMIIVVLAVNGFMAFFLNYANFMTNKKTSPLTVTVAGNLKHVVTILLSVWLFQNEISVMNGIGSAIAVGGAMWYSYIDFRFRHSSPALPVLPTSR